MGADGEGRRETAVQRQGTIRFAVDQMVVKLGKYLRILGYDAVWDQQSRTHELILRANREGRILLSRNRRLAEQYPPVARVQVITSTDPVEQLAEVVRRHALDVRTGLFSRCIRCNVPLDPVADKAEAAGRVHPNVLRRYERFYRCPSCGTVFWKGSHVQNTCRKLGL